MRVFSQSQYPKRDLPSLEGFLRECREIARGRGRYQIASISLAVREIDPLAVLESIFEPREWHFYLERPMENWALAGADEVISCRLEGAERFDQARAFVAEALDNCILIGDLESPFSGPHFFCGFSFFDRPGDDSPFPGGTVFLPRWQVSRIAQGHCAVANVRIDPDSAVEPIAKKVWEAHRKFFAFDYSRPEAECSRAVDRPEGRAAPRQKVGADRLPFRDAVRRALADIRRGRYRKIVLARALDLELSGELNPLHALNDLRMRYPACYAYSLANGRGQSFIGASPERLLRIGNRRLTTEALAGSAPRGRSAAADAVLGRELLGSEKDRSEHAIVVESICRRLRESGLVPELGAEPELLRLSNVQHLRTPIAADLSEGLDLFSILALLHPTPAVGGAPREAACPAIPDLEPFDRGLYAGPVGWVDHRGAGEFTVAIRSALVDGRRARVFAGAGIVADSDPDSEWREIDLKFNSLLEALF